MSQSLPASAHFVCCRIRSPLRRSDFIGSHQKEKPAMTKLTIAARKKIPTSEFALPGRRYPIEDKAHARNALARVSQDGTPAEKVTVRRKVHRLFPGLKQES
jgi:hypothetical protein